MSQYDPSKQGLKSRLRPRERKREIYWPGTTQQSWSAQANRELDGTQSDQKDFSIPPRKSRSPQYLPRLEGAVRYADNSQNLRHGKMKVVPPLGTKQNDHMTSVHPDERADYRPEQEAAGYPAGLMIAPWFRGMQQNSPDHPPSLYSVPVVPVFMPHVLPDQRYFWHRRNDRSVHHMTRREAATIIQKYFRGWQVRQGASFCPFRAMCNKKFAACFIESFIEGILMEDLIPDVLIETFSRKKYLSTRDPRYQASESVCQDIFHQEVTMFICETAASVFYSHVQSLSKLPHGDPLHQVCNDLIGELVEQATREQLLGALSGMVQSHMAISKSGDWLDELIAETLEPMAYIVARETVQNYEFDSAVDELIDEVVAPIQQAVVMETWLETVDISRELEVIKLRKYAQEHFLDSVCLQYLLNQLTGSNLSLYFKDYVEQVMDGLVCGVLSQQLFSIEDEESETLTNSALKEYNQNIFSDVALDMLLEELSANLDEDIEDLLQVEKEKRRFEL